jgi:hypothetical protein
VITRFSKLKPNKIEQLRKFCLTQVDILTKRWWSQKAGNLLLESKDIDVNEHERLPNITLKTQIRLESMDIDVNEHERLPNI